MATIARTDDFVLWTILTLAAGFSHDVDDVDLPSVLDEAQLVAAYGPNWSAVVDLIRRARTLTVDEAERQHRAYAAQWAIPGRLADDDLAADRFYDAVEQRADEARRAKDGIHMARLRDRVWPPPGISNADFEAMWALGVPPNIADAAFEAIQATVVADLLSPEDLAVMTAPWRDGLQ